MRSNELSEVTSHTWAVVLAAGEGRRIQSLTRTASGEIIPKQFCSLGRRECFLELAMARGAAVVGADHLCTVVAAQHRRWWKRALGDTSATNIFVQPSNRGTAIGAALSLLEIEKRDPEATVMLLPADHHVSDEAALAGALRETTELADEHRDRIYMLGMETDSPDTELGYIVPKPGCVEGAAAVEEFVEKPSSERARDLLARGSLWNMFIVAGTVTAFLNLFDRSYNFVSLMRDTLRDGQPLGSLSRLYQELPPVDFSRDVLSHHVDRLRVVAAPPCGWTDLGTPSSVAATIEATIKESRSRAGATSPAPSALYLDLALGGGIGA
jgi:mannose-1-phosphate guanylyltransferase